MHGIVPDMNEGKRMKLWSVPCTLLYLCII